jgi:hypothetical protein
VHVPSRKKFRNLVCWIRSYTISLPWPAPSTKISFSEKKTFLEMFEIVSNGLNFFQIVSGFQSFSEENGLFPSNVYEVNPWAVAVAVWARKAPPGRTDSPADYSEAGPCKRGTEEAWSRHPSESQGGSGLIQSKVWCEIV